MPYLLRKANPHDASRLAALLQAYMRETYQGTWGGNSQLLEQHLSIHQVEIILAETTSSEIIGFIAWIDSYDLHWCLKGGEVIDFFVNPSHRGGGAAPLLIAKAAGDIQARGGEYLKGGAVENRAVRQFYGKIGICLGNGEFYLSGRAFRGLAELSGKSLREIIKGLPEKAWNYEP